jgi:L-phenylalanine/L-methionine N-acetyltransferase
LQSVSDLLVRRVRRDDAAAVAATMSDPLVARGLLQMPHGSEDFWRKRIDEMPAGNAANEIMLVAERGGVVIGNAGLHGVAALRRRHVAGLGIAVARASQSQGVGSALMAALIDWADQWAQVLRIELTVFADNDAAIALYRKFGFEHEGTHRAYALRDGVYADVHAMARLHPAPPAIR